MSALFELGKRNGTDLDPQDITLQEALQIYQEEVEGLPDLKSDAAQHDEYMQGWITGARESLGGNQ